MAPRKKTRAPVRAVPLPEAIDGNDWQIQESPVPRHAGIARSFGEGPKLRKMIVPLGREELDRTVRLHEMMHVKITPDEFEMVANELPEDILNTVEDARVHGHLTRLGFDLDGMRGLISDREMESMAKEAHPAVLAGLGAAFCNTGEAIRMEDLLDELPPDRMGAYRFGQNLAYRRMHQSELPSFDATIQMTRDIIEVFGRHDRPPPPKSFRQTVAELAGDMINSLTREGVDLSFTEPDGKPKETKPHGETWSRVRFEEPPLTLKLPAKMRGKKRRIPDQRGRRLHRVGRLYHDGRVFGDRPPLRGGGAVLIDCSGSMGLTIEQVIGLCHMFPAGVIGAYSSHSDVGTLRVIARKGKRVEDHLINPPGGGNGIDGPALDWLALQTGPRFWISDAGVSGGPGGLRYCIAVCLKHQITRVDNAHELLEGYIV